MRTKLETAHSVSSIGTFVFTIVLVALAIVPMLWPPHAGQDSHLAQDSAPAPTVQPMTGWLMPSILAVCILLAGALNFLAARERRLASLVQPQALQRIPISFTPPLTVLPAPVPSPEERMRIFVGPDITPQFLIDLSKDHTEIQAGKLLELYIGKWMKVSGDVDDVAEITSELSMVIFSGTQLTTPSVFMIFNKKWLGHLSILRRGNKIAVEGRIRKVEGRKIHLDHCELV